MPRYKTVAVMLCEHGHNTIETELGLADSPEHAAKLAVESISKRLCQTYNGVLKTGRMLGSEEIELHPQYTVYSYVCQCGERVEYARVEVGIGFTPPASRTLSCSRGHQRTILNSQFLGLDRSMGKSQ